MPVYLDNNASTPLDDRVLSAMQPWLGQLAGNASSLHRYGRLQRDAIETARRQVAALVGTQPEQVIFTSGGTEANNLVLTGVLAATDKSALAIGATEHMSVLQPAQALQRHGSELIMLPVDGNGLLDIAAAEHHIAEAQERIGLVSVMMANNETGVLQDIESLASITRAHDVLLHTDATQAAGKLPLNFAASGCDAMTLSAHKIYGPQGVGALVIDRRLPLEPMLYGGVQEHGYRAGTENVAAIAGFGAAAELAMQELTQRAEHTAALRDALHNELAQLTDIEIFAADTARLPNTIQFGVRGFDGETLLMQLDRKGIAVSSGSACTSGKTEPSHVLQAMNIDRALSLSAVRVSFGKDNNMQDVTQLVDSLRSIIEMKSDAVMMAATL